MKDSRFHPATQDDVPVLQCGLRNLMEFRLDPPSNYAGYHFVGRFERFHRAIKKEQFERAQGILDKMGLKGRRNLYEDAFYYLAMSRLAEAQGDKVLEQQALQRATARGVVYLGRKTYRKEAKRLLKLQLEQHNYGAAEMTLAGMKPHLSEQQLQDLAPLIARLERARRGAYAFTLNGSLDSSPASIRLLRDAFSIEAVEGELREVEMFCGARHQRFDYKSRAWVGVEAAKSCWVFLTGEPGTRFAFTQHPKSS